MANNLNQKIPRYVESDLGKSKLLSPPRNKNKEINIYIYETNQNIILVENTDGSLAIQARLVKTIKFNSTTPLNFDIAKPKFSSISDSAIWGTQINGFIYEELNLDISKYNFITLTVAQTDTIKIIAKYRIVNYNPISDNNNKFLYAEISLVLDSSKTIKSLEKINWKIVNDFNNDTATKYIKIAVDKTAFISSAGLKIKGKRAPGFINLVNGPFNLTNATPNLTLLFVTLRNQDPFEFDIAEIARFKRQGRFNGLEILYANPFNRNPFSSVSFRSTTNNQILMDVRYNSNYPLVQGSFIIPENKYFDAGFEFINNENGVTFRQKNLSLNDIKSFLNGTFSIAGELIPKFDKPIFSSSPKKTEDLDSSNEIDKQYFVLSKKINLQNLFNLSAISGSPASVTIKFKSLDGNKRPDAKTNLFRVEEWADLLETQDGTDDFITFELELLTPLFNPNIELLNLNNGIIKITTYNEQHVIIENELNFQPDETGKTIIQL